MGPAKCEYGGVVEGCQIRELPDGGREFVLEQTSLSFVRVDHQSRLQFGLTEVVIASPFLVEIAGRSHRLDPQRWDALGPLVALFPGSIRWLWTSVSGILTGVFHNGSKIVVSPDPMVKAWSVGSVHSLPGGPG